MKRLLLILLHIIPGTACIFATPPHTVDVSFRHLKNMEYEISAIAYRDCRGTPLSSFGLTIYNDSFAIAGTPTRVKIEDIFYYCKTKPCTPSNSTVGTMGTEAHFIMDTIDFNSGVFKKFISKKYCNVYFAFTACCRNGALTSMNPGAIFVESMLNLCLAIKSPVNSPKFVNTISIAAQCNQTFCYSFYANNYFAGDSISYELVQAKNDANSPVSYNTNYIASAPVLPYCQPPGNYNCSPLIGANPVWGSFFNSSNGNFLITPTKCTDVGTVVCQVNLFRKDSGKYKLVSYSKRDMFIVVSASSINKPGLNTYRDYSFKARENACIDIKVKDDTTKTNKDTVKLIVKEFPKYGTLTLKDSNAREKTLHFCWTPSSADYLNKREANIAIYAYDKPCTFGQSMSTVINFKVDPPDSFTNIIIKTFYDKNKNGKKDAGEPFRSAPVLLDKNQVLTFYQTDSSGQLNLKPLYSKFTYNINRNQFLYSTSKDTTINAKFDSTYIITLGFNYYQGIKGKIFEDVNNNCVFDAGDIALKGVKVISQKKNAVALSDNNGDYLFNTTLGNHILTVDVNSPYENLCNTGLNITIAKDSQFSNYNFPLRKKNGFKDVAITLIPLRHNSNGVSMTQNIVIENKAGTSAKAFYIKLLPSRKLYQFSSTSTNSNSKDTILWLIDSIVQGGSKTIAFSHTLMTDSFSNGDQITYQLWAAYKDDVPSNNIYELTETVNDYACCKTEKVVYAPYKYYPVNNSITYRTYFIPATPTKRVLISDNIDTLRFDIRTLIILKNNGSQTVYVKGNTLYADEVQGGFLGSTELVYSLDLKPPMTDSFTAYNSASCYLDYQSPLFTNNTSTTIVTPIGYDSTNKSAYCTNENILLSFYTNYKPASDNHFRVFISDTFGNFSPLGLLLDTATAGTKNTLKVRIPNIIKPHAYKLKVTGTNPAVEAWAYVSKPNVIINPVPKVSYTDNLNNGKICELDTLLINAHGKYNYRFIKNGIAIGGFGKDSIYSEKMTGRADYAIEVRSAEGCITTSPLINATLFNTPIITLSTNNNILCDGESITLQLSGANSYKLYRSPNNLIATGITSSSFTLSPPVNTSQYSIIGTDLNGCRDTSNTVIIKVNPLPAKPVITRIGKSLQSSYISGNQWYSINGKIDSAMKRFFYPQKDGKYFVRFKDSNGCENTSDLFEVTYTNINSINGIHLFKVYPNPASQIILIENTMELSYRYDLFDTYGRNILNDLSGEKLHTINIEQLSAGNYTLRLNADGRVLNFKLLILK